MIPINSLSNLGNATKPSSAPLAGDAKAALAELFLLIVAIEAVVWTDNKRLLAPPERALGHFALLAVIAVLLLRQWPSHAQVGLKPSSWLQGTGGLALMT